MTLKRMFLAIIILVLILTGCSEPGGGNGNNGNGNNGNTGTPKTLSVGYLSNLMIDIGDATALGISKRPVNSSRSARAVADVTEISEKNYLVKITTDISHGNVEWDESGLTNVTFKKKTTTDTIIFIPVFDEEGNPVYVLGEDGEPLLDEDGEPIQEMEELLDNQTVTQDEIPAQVNRLYVYNTYTYIQFVPDDTTAIPDTRPDDLGTPDKAGYFDYDKGDFYNDDFHQSFVIENITGNIYSVDDTVHIESIHNGLLKVKDSPWIYDLRINANDELEIFSLFQNATVNVIDYYKDKFNNNFIFNDTLDAKDSSTNTLFFKYSEYFVSTTGEVLYIEDFGEYSSNVTTLNPTYMNHFVGRAGINTSFYINTHQIKLVGQGLSLRNITVEDNLQFNGFTGHQSLREYAGSSFVSHLENKKLYLYGVRSIGGHGDFVVIDTDTGIPSSQITIIGGTYIYPMLYDTVVICNVSAYTNISNIFYYKIDYTSLPDGQTEILVHDVHDTNDMNNIVMLLQNVERINTGVNIGAWEVNTINSRDEYTVVLQEVNGERIPVAVKVSEYVAEEQQVITLKPINR